MIANTMLEGHIQVNVISIITSMQEYQIGIQWNAQSEFWSPNPSGLHDFLNCLRPPLLNSYSFFEVSGKMICLLFPILIHWEYGVHDNKYVQTKWQIWLSCSYYSTFQIHDRVGLTALLVLIILQWSASFEKRKFESCHLSWSIWICCRNEFCSSSMRSLLLMDSIDLITVMCFHFIIKG